MLDRLETLAGQFRGALVLVTGAGGFVGANLVRLLVNNGCAPHAVVRPVSQPWRLRDIAQLVVLHEADLADVSSLEKVWESVRPDYVFHLATPRGDTEKAREEMLRVSTFGAMELIRLMKEYPIKRLVASGSSLEYASSASALQESSAISPVTWHGATKAAAHIMFRQSALAEGAPVVWLRLFHVYGPWESAHRLAPTAIRAVLSGTPLALTAPGIRHDWVFIEDVLEALLLATSKGDPGDVFNIGSGVEVANEEFVACVESATGLKARIAPERVPRRVADAEHRYADRTLAAQILGWRPRHDLLQGVRRTLAWYEAHSDAWSMECDVRPKMI